MNGKNNNVGRVTYRLRKVELGHIVYHLGKDGKEYLAKTERDHSNPFFDNGLHKPGENSFTADIGRAKLCCEQEAKERAAAINEALPEGHPIKGFVFSGKLVIEMSGK